MAGLAGQNVGADEVLDAASDGAFIGRSVDVIREAAGSANVGEVLENERRVGDALGDSQHAHFAVAEQDIAERAFPADVVASVVVDAILNKARPAAVGETVVDVALLAKLVVGCVLCAVRDDNRGQTDPLDEVEAGQTLKANSAVVPPLAVGRLGEAAFLRGAPGLVGILAVAVPAAVVVDRAVVRDGSALAGGWTYAESRA